MNNTYSDLSSTLPSYSSNGSHAPPPAKLPLGKPGSRVFDTHSTYSEDGGTTSKKALDTTRKVAPVAGTVVWLCKPLPPRFMASRVSRLAPQMQTSQSFCLAGVRRDCNLPESPSQPNAMDRSLWPCRLHDELGLVETLGFYDSVFC